MDIMITKVRIKNYRSIETLTLDLNMSNLLLGQNNSGKSNFLRALNTAISGISDLSENDIFVCDGERLEKTKTAIIDLLIQPNDEDGRVRNEFSGFWTSVFTDTWITTSAEGNFVGIRSEIKYDPVKDSYALNRRCIRQWKEDVETAIIDSKRSAFNDEMRSFFQVFYMDANRDIVQDMRNRKSYFGRVISSYEMEIEKVKEIEEQLNLINKMIIDSIPSLTLTKNKISAIGKTIGSQSSTVEVEPLARKISDINKGIDIIMKDGSAAAFPISQHGYGTRSWVSFLTLSAFIENQKERVLADDEEAEQYNLLTMEEPESHLHPQAQRLLFEQILQFPGQKIISTHSPSVVAQSDLSDMIYFSKLNGRTTAIQYKNCEHGVSDDMKIFRGVINTRAELLFASAVILCEGITEELALPVYFQEHFGCSPFGLGVSIINIGGKDNYSPFLSLMKDFAIPWFIFSDGEVEAISSIQSAVMRIFQIDCISLDNVIILANGDDYEKYLIDEGYSELLINAICEHEDDKDFFDSYITNKNGQRRKGGIVRNYQNSAGRIEALKDICHERKTEYAIPVAKKLVGQEDKAQRIPKKVEQLFLALTRKIGFQKIIIKEASE